MRGISDNGVKIDFDNCCIYGTDKPILAMKDGNLTEVNLNGYLIQKLPEFRIGLYSGSEIIIDEYIDRIHIGKDGIDINTQNGETIRLPAGLIKNILGV